MLRKLLSMSRTERIRGAAVLTGVLAFGGIGMSLSGCNDAQAGAFLGAGIGALAGQAIGHDTESTLIGGAVGAGAGYILGNESDKAKHNRYHHHHGRYNY